MEKLPKTRNEMDVPKTEEKKLTDEDIVQVLDECFAKVGVMSCKDCKVYSGNGLRGCMKNIGRLTIDLIHRLQAENEQLKCDTYKTSWKGKFLEAKKEIERLTEELTEEKKHYFDMQNVASARYMENCKLIKQRNELQKQVDELKDELELQKNLYKRAEESGYCTGYKSAVKDTAKEIYEELHKIFETVFVIGDLYVSGNDIWKQINGKLNEILKQKGVEVDE